MMIFVRMNLGTRSCYKYPFAYVFFATLMYIGPCNSSYGPTTSENLKKLATANNIFALNLHKALSAGSQGNVFFSPLSLSTAFGMLYYGVRGESAKELRQVLGYEDAKLPDDAIHPTFHQLLTQISNSSNHYTLRSANTILVDERLSLRPEYQRGIQDLYQSPVRVVDFARDGQRIVKDINGWVEAKTEGMIRQLLEDLSPETAMVLLNAVYFKGKWKVPFHPGNTKREAFYNGGLELGSQFVPMMNLIATFPYKDTNDYQAVELPYVGNNLSMLILLPKHMDYLPSLEQQLTSTKLDEIRQSMPPKKLDLYIPRFKMEFSKNLPPELQRLGIEKIFKNGSEDFSGISARDSRKLTVADVIHKSKIEVNEEGTKAAAVTGISKIFVMVMVQRTIVVRVNHPFVFFILDKRNGFILFMGRLLKM